jgi:UDP-glucose 4-epimerase
MKKKILITGSAGMLGSCFTSYFIDNYGTEYDVYGVDDFSGSYRESVDERSIFTELDLRDKEKTANYFEKNFGESGIDIVVHYAAAAQEIRSYFSPIYNASVNDDTAKNTITNAIKYNVQLIVFSTSMSRYGDGVYKNGDNQMFEQKVPFKEYYIPCPKDPYAASKVYIENYIQALQVVHNFNYLIICPHNIFGKYQFVEPYRNFIAIWMNLILQDKDCYIYGEGLQTRAISWVDDYNPAICKAMFNENMHNQIFNIGGDEEKTINEWYNIVNKVTGYNKDAIHVEARPGEVFKAYCDHTKAQDLLSFKNTVKMEDAIAEMWEHFKEVGPRPFKYLNSFEIDSPKIPVTWRKKLF